MATICTTYEEIGNPVNEDYKLKTGIQVLLDLVNFTK